MTKKIYDGMIPFSPRDLSQYVYPKHDAIWKQNKKFKAVLTFVRFERGRSAAHAIFRRGTGTWGVVVFLADLATMLPYMQNGKVEGEFAFCKRGQNFGCQLISVGNDGEL